MVGPLSTEAAPLRIAFFGTPEFAVPTLRALLGSRHTVCGVVTRPDKPRGRGHHVRPPPVKVLALEHQCPLLQPTDLKDAALAEAIRAWSPDVGVVAAYGKLIPEALLQIPRFGMINVHASLLPRYRGAAPVHRAIIDGQPETGVTIMRVVAALDAGGMLAKVKRTIEPDETSDVVERDLSERGARLLVEVVDRLAAGEIEAESQDDRLSTYAPRLTKTEGLLDWALPAADLHNRVRGLYPWPHAYTYLDGARMTVRRTHVVAGPTEHAPGTVVHVAHGALQVATGHGLLSLDEIQLDGRRPMTTRDFLAGRPIRPGVRFSDS